MEETVLIAAPFPLPLPFPLPDPPVLVVATAGGLVAAVASVQGGFCPVWLPPLVLTPPRPTKCILSRVLCTFGGMARHDAPPAPDLVWTPVPATELFPWSLPGVAEAPVSPVGVPHPFPPLGIFLGVCFIFAIFLELAMFLFIT